MWFTNLRTSMCNNDHKRLYLESKTLCISCSKTFCIQNPTYIYYSQLRKNNYSLYFRYFLLNELNYDEKQYYNITLGVWQLKHIPQHK